MLYIVSTPIGNMGDISKRALDTLKSCNLILAEDTRNTRKIAMKFAISTRIESLHEHSTKEKIKHYIDMMQDGSDIAYVSDAGTPNISDPGGKLVEMAYIGNISVSPIPGPSSLTALISVAPFSCSEFVFRGFFPKKKGREKIAQEIKNTNLPFFFFESPMRIIKTLTFLREKLPQYHVLIGREMTKMFEEIIVIDFSDSGSGEQILSVKAKGEFVIALYK